MKLYRTYFSVTELVILFQVLCIKSLSTAGHEDTEHHERSTDNRHLLGHLGDWLDLDGQALRHIEDHLQTLIDSRDDIKDIADGDNSKGLFYFFKIHDHDNNDKLDGLEWFKALTDFHEVSQKNGVEEYDEVEVVTMIDDLLKKHDLDEDGYISFHEMINSKPDSLFNELDRLDEAEENQHENENAQESQKSRENSNIRIVDSQGEEQSEKIVDSQENEGQNEKIVDSQENEEQSEKVLDSQENEEQSEKVLDPQE